MEVNGEIHASAALLPGKEPRYSLNRRLGGPQGRFGRCWISKHLLLLPGIDSRPSSPQPVATPALNIFKNFTT
jgi:hypothetical protein